MAFRRSPVRTRSGPPAFAHARLRPSVSYGSASQAKAGNPLRRVHTLSLRSRQAASSLWLAARPGQTRGAFLLGLQRLHTVCVPGTAESAYQERRLPSFQRNVHCVVCGTALALRAQVPAPKRIVYILKSHHAAAFLCRRHWNTLRSALGSQCRSLPPYCPPSAVVSTCCDQVCERVEGVALRAISEVAVRTGVRDAAFRPTTGVLN